MDNKLVKQVIVVFKTHLDIGFTALAEDVLDSYCKSFIPSAVKLALRVNTPGKKRFVWTVGSFLPMHYLRTAAPQERALFEEAVRLGYVRWHGLPCTTHTELMDADLMEYGLLIGQDLDRQFNVHTAAAKMTDVPGHTAAMVPLLAKHGIEYLHIGVNASSRVPDVPPLFRWRFQESEITVSYAADYGEAAVLDNGTALEFLHSQDNMGPPDEKLLEQEYKRLAAKYPNARIEAGTLDDFARAIRSVRETLPVLEQEIGDTWIHGVGSDPLKVSALRRLLALKSRWLEGGRITGGESWYGNFMLPLLLTAEHTWGMDTKKYLLDFTHWNKEAFADARERDITSYRLLAAGPREQALADQLIPELIRYRGSDNCQSSYRLFEQSHDEQRKYIEDAICALPPELAAEARRGLSWKPPHFPHRQSSSVRITGGFTADIGCWRVHLGKYGQITCLEHRESGIRRTLCLGMFAYETFSAETVQTCLETYGRDMEQNRHWAEFDFGKPGLEYESGIRDACFYAEPVTAECGENSLTIFMRGNEEAVRLYGCPRRIFIRHVFEQDQIVTTLYWQDKDAIRSPEALWLYMNPLPGCRHWTLQKLGQQICPDQVVSGGARRMHCCEALRGTSKDGAAAIYPMDAPLVSVGGRSLYQTDDSFPDCGEGFWFNLFNNRWGTNFKQWFEEDMRFCFVTKFDWR